MTRIAGLLALFLGVATGVMPNVDRHGIGLRHFSEAQATDEKEIVAAQIRKQGFSCDKPVNAERELPHQKSHEAVWVLRCENASYRVRLIPRMPARVERLD
jgi:hypothetical protein